MIHIGLRSMITNENKTDWEYLLFYDIDRKFNQNDFDFITETLNSISYIVYSTKNGFHVVGLTPLDCISWGYLFDSFKTHYNNYYSGHTIRMSRKKDEKQKLIMYSDLFDVSYPLARIYEKRFNIVMQNRINNHAVFEKYGTRKT